MPSIARSPFLLVAVALVVSPTLAADSSPVTEPELVLEVSASGQPASEMSLIDAHVVNVHDAKIVAMSPDGRSVAVARQTAEAPAGQLCVLNLDSLDEVACADLAQLQAGLRIDDVTWSPDSRSLAFTERALEVFMDGDLWLMDAASGELTNLLDDGFEGPLPIMQREPSAGTITIPANPTFSPDGTTLAFSRSLIIDGAMAGNDVVTLSVDDGDPVRLWVIDPRLIGVAYMGMGWAPNGEQLYVSVSDPGGRDERDGIWVVDATGGEGRQLVGRYQPGGSALALLAVAADGQHLLAYDPALSGRQADGVPALALIDTRTGSATPLLGAGETNAQKRPARWAGFSPDGGTLVTLVNAADAGTLTVWEADGAQEYPLSLPAELARLAAAGPAVHRSAGTWSPGGRALLALAADPASALVLEIDGSGVTSTAPAVE